MTKVGAANSSPRNSSDERFTSVDAFRGLLVLTFAVSSIAVPILSKFPETGTIDFLREQLRPTVDDGFSLYDLLLPGFLLVAGISTVLSHQRRRAEGQTRIALLRHVARRGFLLYAIGFLLGRFSQPWPDDVLTAPLQQIAICYVIGAFVELFTTGWLVIVFVSMAILPAYWTLIEGFGDQPVIGENFVTLLTIIPAMTVTFAGVAVGRFLQANRMDAFKICFALYVSGLVCVDLSLLWNEFWPCDPGKWTSSFALAAIGILCLCLVLFTIFDSTAFSGAALPFVMLGRNSLLLIIAVEALHFASLSELLEGGDIGAYLRNLAPLINALTQLAVFYLAAAFLYRKRLFLTASLNLPRRHR